MNALDTLAFLCLFIGLQYPAYDFYKSFISIDKKRYSSSLKKHIINSIMFLAAFLLYILGYVSEQTIISGLKAGAVLAGIWIGAMILLMIIIRYMVRRHSEKYKEFSTINDMGFSYGDRQKTVHYSWDDFDSAVIDPLTLTVQLSGKKRLIVKKNCIRFYNFLMKIPRYYKDFDYKIIDNFFDSLKPCKICGLIAVKDELCLYCFCEEWNSEIEQDFTYDEYIRTFQLEVFANPDQIEDSFDFKLNDHYFKTDPEWKPSVTKREVLDYFND